MQQDDQRTADTGLHRPYPHVFSARRSIGPSLKYMQCEALTYGLFFLHFGCATCFGRGHEECGGVSSMNTKQFFGCFYCVGVFGGGLFLGECTSLPQGRKGPGGSGQKCSLEHRCKCCSAAER